MQKTCMEQQLEGLHAKKGFICDMDGVIYHGDRLLPGVPEFVGWLQREKKRFILYGSEPFHHASRAKGAPGIPEKLL